MAQPSKIEVDEFHLLSPRFLQQVGQVEPEYVAAAPNAPVKVRLPRYIMREGEKVLQPEDANLVRLAPKPLKEPRPGASGSPVPKSHQRNKLPPPGSSPVVDEVEDLDEADGDPEGVDEVEETDDAELDAPPRTAPRAPKAAKAGAKKKAKKGAKKAAAAEAAEPETAAEPE